MRISGVTSTTIGLEPDKKICAQVSGGPALCVPFSKLPDKTGSAGRLAVSTEDLDRGRIYMSIRDAKGAILAQGFAHRRPGTTKFLASGLCAGFLLVLDEPPVSVTVYLDAY